MFLNKEYSEGVGQEMFGGALRGTFLVEESATENKMEVKED